MTEISSAEKNYYSLARFEMTKYIPSNANTILDVGCGEGSFGVYLKKENKTVWGVEIHKESAEKAQTCLDKVLIGSIEENLANLPDGYFDCIIFNDVLEHLLDPEMVLGIIKNKLTPNGVIVSSIPNFRYWKNILKLLYTRDWKYEDSGILDRTHFRFFTYLSIKRMFTDLNFEIVTLEGINGSKSLRFDLFNAFFFFKSGDARFLQFACVAKKK